MNRNQIGGSVGQPARWFDNKNLFKGPNCSSCGCASKNQEGGAVRMPARYFNDLNLFRGPNCDGCQNKQIAHLYNPCECARNQIGGTAIGAPFHIFSTGAPLKQSKPIQSGEGPVFDQLPPSCHW